MDFSWITAETLEKSALAVICLGLLTLMIILVRVHRQDTKEFNKTLGNHLAHTDITQKDDIASREKLAGIISTQTEISREILTAVKDIAKRP